MANNTHSEELAGHGERWEAWESKFIGWSIGIGIAGLIVLGILIDIFILPD